MSSSRRTRRLRPIAPADNREVARIIRRVMAEFGALGDGYSSEDQEIDDIYGAYSAPDSAFWVIEEDGKVLGCGGFGPLAGADDPVCELRKMYFLPVLRGQGMGARLLELCIEEARARGFRGMYLETMATMNDARNLYFKYGFRELDAPMGCTGHWGCNSWMFKSLAGKR